MQLKCSKCQRVINIVEEKIPRDREKAMIKCPGCQQVLVFTIPQALRNPVPQADKTIISQGPAGKSAGLPRLCRISDDFEYPLMPGKNIIGREAGISITGDRYISRLHCLVEVVEKYSTTLCILTDDGSISESGEPSTNGTFYNESRLTRYDKIYLNHGDKVRIGRTELVFRIES